jgi:hypothetical protein
LIASPLQRAYDFVKELFATFVQGEKEPVESLGRPLDGILDVPAAQSCHVLDPVDAIRACQLN